MTTQQLYRRFSLTPEMIDRLENLIDVVPPDELREYLLEIYHSYIIHEHESLPANFSDMAQSMQILFDFLKFLDEEIKNESIN
jgi:hypothetical protein